MYVRLVSFKLKDGMEEKALGLVYNIIPEIKSQTGFQDCKYLMHPADNEYALIVYWDSVANADAASKIIGPKLIPEINKISVNPAILRLYEIYEPSET